MDRAEEIAEGYTNQIPMSDAQARAIAYGTHYGENHEVQCHLYFLLMDID